MIGYAFTGSFCTLGASLTELEWLLSAGYDILPIMSENVYTTDTRFYKAEEFIKKVETLCSHPIIHTVKDAEPLGAKSPLEYLIISPCTGNTLAKLANGITDTPVTMAAKAHLRNGKPLIIALATNDAMSANFKNIAVMLEKKNVYFVPLVQDDPAGKPSSLVADFEKIEETVEYASRGIQIRPLFL